MHTNPAIAARLPSSGSASFRALMLAVSVAAALSLTACKKQGTDPVVTGAIANPVTQDDFQAAVDYWGQRYDKNQKDKANALNYASALLKVGRNEQSLAILQRAAINFPDDRDVLAAYGKGLAANGQLEQALAVVRRAQTPDRPDWRLLSAEGAILDQLGQNEAARKLYAQGILIAPNEATLHSNLGMSYLLTGDLTNAEKTLRRAAELPGADSRVRQNLALVVGLQGRFGEAEQIAKAELSPEQAAANIAYLKQMLADQDSWQSLRAANGAPAERGRS